MTILPKKKAEEESDSDEDASAGCSHESSPHAAAGHAALSAPNSPEEVVAFQGPDGFYHRRYDISSSSGESSPELPSLNKRTSYRLSPVATASGPPGKKSLDTSPGYNSAEEYDGSRRPYVDHEGERQFENALRKERGFVIKKMRPDGACLFRAVADQIYGDQEMHGIVRSNCMDYMLKNAEFFSQYVTDEDFEHYVNRKRLDQCYGNNIEMQAMAELYNRPIEVYQYSIEPINIFFGVYKTDSAPLRLSYHGSIHYNSVVDPYNATVGVGLGLAGFKPGLADKMQVVEAQRESENIHIEQAMLEDKKRSTDWDATYDALEEAVTRESYLTWLRENEKREQSGGKPAGSQPSSSACRGNSPPVASTSSSHGGTKKAVHSTTPSSPATSSISLSGSALVDHKKFDAKKSRPSPPGGRGLGDGNSPVKSTSSSHRVGGGRNGSSGNEGGRKLTPSPSLAEHHHNQHHHRRRHNHSHGQQHGTNPHSHHHRQQYGRGSSLNGSGLSSPNSGGNSGSIPSNVRSSPYYSSKEHRKGNSGRGSSLRHSPKESSHGGSSNNGSRRSAGRYSLRDDDGSITPSPPPSSPTSPHLHHLSQSPPSSSETSPNHHRHLFHHHHHRSSPTLLLRQSARPNLNDPGNSPPSTPPIVPLPLLHSPGLIRHSTSPGSSHNVNANTVSLLVSTSPPTSSLLPYGVDAHGGVGGVAPSGSKAESPSPPRSGSQSPAHTLSFEDGRVLSQLPYEYSSFLDLPPSALGLSEWEDDQILAAVLAASQQEYIDGLRQSRNPDPEDH